MITVVVLVDDPFLGDALALPQNDYGPDPLYSFRAFAIAGLR